MRDADAVESHSTTVTDLDGSNPQTHTTHVVSTRLDERQYRQLREMMDLMDAVGGTVGLPPVTPAHAVRHILELRYVDLRERGEL